MFKQAFRRGSGLSLLPLAVGLAQPIAFAGEAIEEPKPAAIGGTPADKQPDPSDRRVRYRTVQVDGVDIFYREAGPENAPTLLLLHGFPTSSQMFRELIPLLSDRYHVVAPDYPGFGQSAQPPRETFAYTFDHLAKIVDGFTEQLKLDKFTIYVQDYGAPIGYRIASAHPERISGIIVQNGNAYDEGLDNDFWKPIKKYWAEPTTDNREALRGFLTIDGTKWQYVHGARKAEHISPDAWTLDQAGLDRPGNKDIQLDLFLSYGTNPPLYPKWQQYFREHQPPTLIVWGKNDQIFPAAGAAPYKRDLKNIDFNLIDTGHFALEEESALIGAKIRDFMQSRVEKSAK
jgi:pimeloyl-ACP methyl ester carboxylesterase